MFAPSPASNRRKQVLLSFTIFVFGFHSGSAPTAISSQSNSSSIA
jgi:hypothetical protein